jgi:hypothetical protein
MLFVGSVAFAVCFKKKLLGLKMFWERPDPEAPAADSWLSVYSHPLAFQPHCKELLSQAFSRELLVPHGRNLV